MLPSNYHANDILKIEDDKDSLASVLSWNKLNGVSIPKLTDQQLDVLFGKDRPLWTLAYTSDLNFVGCPSLRIGLNQLKVGTEAFFGKGVWYELMSRILPPGGQLKNFLNAAFQTRFLADGAKILLIGSKAAQGGGSWVDLFGSFLATWLKDISIDCYDSGEIAGKKVHPSGRVTVTRYARWYKGDASNYDLVVDDSYVAGIGVPRNEYKATFQSLKLSDDIKGIRFLHWQERRLFIPAPVFGPTLCSCQRCQIEGQFPPGVRDSLQRYTDYIEVSRCRVVLPELLAINSLWQEVAFSDSAVAVTPVEHRALIAIQKTIGGTLTGERRDLEGKVRIGFSAKVKKLPKVSGLRPILVGITAAALGFDVDTKMPLGDYGYAISEEGFLAISYLKTVYYPGVMRGWTRNGLEHKAPDGRIFYGYCRKGIHVPILPLLLKEVRKEHWGVASRKTKIFEVTVCGVRVGQYDSASSAPLLPFGISVSTGQIFGTAELTLFSDTSWCSICSSMNSCDHWGGPVACSVCGFGFCKHRILYPVAKCRCGYYRVQFGPECIGCESNGSLAFKPEWFAHFLPARDVVKKVSSFYHGWCPPLNVLCSLLSLNNIDGRKWHLGTVPYTPEEATLMINSKVWDLVRLRLKS